MNKKDKDSDLALVRRVKKGDYAAFDLLVLKYQSRVI
ncbi:MAG: RNA polymerase sigma factor RpoE, partial [Pseudomonadota bacterium]|nr:RNA polymerase sigma factor RpoE [Pseudomonadota bacterium]